MTISHVIGLIRPSFELTTFRKGSLRSTDSASAFTVHLVKEKHTYDARDLSALNFRSRRELGDRDRESDDDP